MNFNFFFLFTCLGFFIFSDILSAVAFGLTLTLAARVLLNSNDSFVFREWVLLLYSLNYLLAPAITYRMDSDKILYAMKLTADNYFVLAIPGFILFAVGIYIIPSRIFTPDFNLISKVSKVNEFFLFKMTIFGVFCRLTSTFFSTDVAFFLYLLSLLRFVGVFALFALNPKKYRYLALVLLAIEMYFGFKQALFHDAIMWLIFFVLFYVYVSKPKLVVKFIGAFVLIILVLLVQAFKGAYRERVWLNAESTSFQTISEVGIAKTNSEDLAGEDNLLGTLNRSNQAWIFASTVDNMDRTKDFQGLNIVYLYLESALLPRFLAPNKITAGNRMIFNQFSGHRLDLGTAMGLGVFADGYIAFGKWGVFVFTFILGVLFSLTFKLIGAWSKISPFYVLFLLPILNYAVRPDCELQTTINHLVKSVFVYGGIVYMTKYQFTMQYTSVKKI